MDSSCHGEYSGLASHSMDKLSLFYNALQPEPLGSVTHNQEIDGSTTSLQIRSSARVSKKMRLDSIATPVATVVLDKIDRKDLMKDNGKPEKPEKPEKPDRHDKAEGKQNEGKVKKRPVEVWSQDDKNTFFEALNEYGKDFDSIQSNFVAKAKKKGTAEHLVKTKEQVRLFYHRTWHKISKYLKFNGICSSEIKNAVKEVYGLINYGEIWKRVGFVTEKIISTKLSELVFRGSIQLRVKGKTLRIKTPICRALRRLNRIEENEELMKLPARVTVELRPRTTDAWTRVHCLAQNPRVRALLPLQKRLSSLLTYLSHRWRPSSVKQCEKLVAALKNIESAEHREPEDKKKEKGALLRIAPHPDAKICLPTVNLTEYLTSSTVCLTSYHERFQTWLAEGSAFQALWKPPSKACSRKGGKRQRVNSASEKKTQAVKMAPVKQKENLCPEIEFVNCGAMPNSSSDNNVISQDGGKDQKVSGRDIDKAVNNILSLQHRPDDGASSSTSSSQDMKVELDNKTNVQAQPVSEPVPKVDETEDIISRVRAGWTLDDANSVSIGELYLMFGSDTKLKMEYWWESTPPDPGTVPAPAPPQSISGPSEGENKPEPSTNRIAETLQKLINIARLNYRRAKVICPCGHICGVSKSSANTRRLQPIRALIDNGLNSKPVPPTLSVSVTSIQDGVFRCPLLAPSQFKSPPKPGATEAFKAQLDKFRPKYCNRRGRTVRSKNVVVQRMLPLLPKAPNGHAMVTLKVIPQSSQVSGEFLPIGTTVPVTSQQPTPLLPRPSKHQHILPATSTSNKSSSSGSLLVPSAGAGGLPDLGQDITPVTVHQSVKESGTTSIASTSNSSTTLGMHQVSLAQDSDTLNLHEALAGTATTTNTQPLRSSSPSLSTPVASPPSISNLLELSLPSTVGEELAIATGTGNSLLDHSAAQPSFEGLLPTEGTLQNSGTPPTSPSRILKEADNQWLNSEVADFSLSSFLGHLDSPLKPAASTAPTEDTRLCSDVEAQLQCLMSENSVDYMAKFADLAAQIASSDTSNKK